MKKLLEIPHLMQHYDIEDEFWQGRSCGIVSLAMVLSYHGVEKRLEELIKKGQDIGALNSNLDWMDSGLCNIARNYGFSAFRRRWALAERDREFLTSEGATNKDLSFHEEVLLDEGIFSLKKAIDSGLPLIISINKHFKNTNGGHLAVLNGYFMDKDGELMGFYVNDPVGASYKHKNQFIELEKFVQGWKKRAIYIKR